MGFRSTDGVQIENSGLPRISSHFKYLGPEQRASSFSPRGFAADCVGAALTIKRVLAGCVSDHCASHVVPANFRRKAQ
jgi:hypothetical protein